MSIVAISQTLGSLGDEIGREVAQTLSYEFADRKIILCAADRFSAGLTELQHVSDEKPTLWERFTLATQHYVAYIQAIIWEMAARDNVVLSGRGAPFILRQVAHALRVRITAPERVRVSRVEHQQGLPTEEVTHLVRGSDRETASRLRLLYHVDWDDPLLYDLVLNTEGLDVKQGVRVINEALQHERFQPTIDALMEVKDLSLTARANAALLAHPLTRPLQLSLSCSGGHISIKGMVEREDQRQLAGEVVGKLPWVAGVLNEIAIAPQHLIPE